MLQEIRKLAISHFKGEVLSKDENFKIKKFIQYMEAYYSEMKFDEYDILLNDDHYEKVFKLYKKVMYK